MAPKDSSNPIESQLVPDLPASDALVTPLMEMVVEQYAPDKAVTYWFGGASRSLFAEEQDGRWSLIEYVFPHAGRLFELRWAEGRPVRLWSLNRTLRDMEVDTLVPNPRLKELSFPKEEIQQMELVMQNVPHSLWARLVKLALDAHFIEKPFPQRSAEPRVERRSVSRG